MRGALVFFFSFHGFGVLLMECEGRRSLEHEIALLRGLEGSACDRGMEVGFGAAVKCDTIVRLAEINAMKMPDSMHNLVDGMQASTCKLGDNLANKLFKRGLKPWRTHHTDLDFTILRRVGHAGRAFFLTLRPQLPV